MPCSSAEPAWLLSIFAVAACGGQSQPPADFPSLDPTTSLVAPPTVRSTRTGRTLPDALVAAIGTRPLFMEEFKSFMLFSDERLAAQQIIADWAAAHGLTILAPAKVEELVAKANRGLNPTTGAACGPSLDREFALERWLDAAGHIKAAVHCETECTLQLDFHARGMGTEFYAAPFDTSKPWRDELPLRLASVVDNGGHGRHGHGNNPVEIAGIARGAEDLIEDNDDALEVGRPLGEAIAKQCGMRGLSAELLVDPQGGSAGQPRCERHAGTYNTETDPAIIACACAQVAARVKPTRRQIVTLYAPATAPARAQTKSGHWASGEIIGGSEYRQFGVAWFMPGQYPYNVSQCFAGRMGLEESKEVDASLEFDADGRVRKATIVDPNRLLRAEEHQCLQTALRTLRTPCPAEPNPTGTAWISWRITVDR